MSAVHKAFAAVGLDFRSIRDTVTPTLKESAYVTEGVLTPAEFVAAGDALISSFPAWSWQSGDPTKLKPYLPEDKQYLKTARVPCTARVNSLGSGLKTYNVNLKAGDDKPAGASGFLRSTIADDDELNLWTTVEAEGSGPDQSGYESDDKATSAAAAAAPAGAGAGAGGAEAAEDSDSDSDYADFDELGAAGMVAGTAGGSAAATAAAPAAAGGSAASVSASKPGAGSTSRSTDELRYYDIYITYDNYYRVPRVLLLGVNAVGEPLSATEVMEDVMSDYADKTVTVEAHPHHKDGLSYVAVHPCQHANTMLRFVNAAVDRAQDMYGMSAEMARAQAAAKVHLYLFQFLKFLSGVLPTVTFDATVDFDLATHLRA